jgi:hypothetical protein
MSNKIFILDGVIDQETVQKFIDFESSTPADDTIKIYLSSDGGRMGLTNIMIDIINANPSRFHVCAMEYIYSAAFLLFFSVKCERSLKPATVGAYHMSMTKMQVMDRGIPYFDNDRATVASYPYVKTEILKFLNNIGAGNYAPDIFKGKDVYFQYPELLTFMSYKNGKPQFERRASPGNVQSRKNNKLVLSAEITSTPATDTTV